MTAPVPSREDAERIVATARDRFGVRRAALFRLDAGSGVLTCIASAGPGGGQGWEEQSLPVGVGAAGRAVAEERPVTSADLLADPRIPVAPWLRAAMERERLRAVAAAPLRIAGVVSGALGILDGAGRTFSDEDLGRLAAFADEAGAGLANRDERR
jgi:GAF domain-containing protein